MRKNVLVFFGLFLFSFSAAADDDVRPDFLAPFINSRAPAGHATFRKFFIKVYDANLWADVDTIDYTQPFALSLTYDVSISSKEFVDRTIKEMSVVSDVPESELGVYRASLSKAFPDVKSGDTITALYFPMERVRFFFNGQQTGEVKDKHFPKQFFGVWFSPKTSEPAFRQALLSNSP